MITNSLGQNPSIGFLTVCERETQGLFGGYLVLNVAGRPMEFHCTAPVRANRAQEILYGPTLKPYLYGEQIGKALLAKAKTKPKLVFTDVEDVLAVREFASSPVVYVIKDDGGPTHNAESEPHVRMDEPHRDSPNPFSKKLRLFSIGDQRLAVTHGREGDERELVQRWRSHLENFDLAEPFGRIRDAIDEACRSAK